MARTACGHYDPKKNGFPSPCRQLSSWLPSMPRPGRARENEAFSPRNLQEGGYLLRKLVRCGRCGCSCSALASKQTYGGKFIAATTIVAYEPPAAFSSRSGAHNAAFVPMCWTNWYGKK